MAPKSLLFLQTRKVWNMNRGKRWPNGDVCMKIYEESWSGTWKENIIWIFQIYIWIYERDAGREINFYIFPGFAWFCCSFHFQLSFFPFSLSVPINRLFGMIIQMQKERKGNVFRKVEPWLLVSCKMEGKWSEKQEEGDKNFGTFLFIASIQYSFWSLTVKKSGDCTFRSHVWHENCETEMIIIRLKLDQFFQPIKVGKDQIL